MLLGLAVAAFVAYCNATSSAQLAALYPESGGDELDGVIAIDPAGFAALLELSGPIVVEGFEGQLGPENAEQILLHDQYLDDGDEADREAFLEAAIRALFDELTSGELPGPQSISAALAPMVDGRHLQLQATGADPQSAAWATAMTTGWSRSRSCTVAPRGSARPAAAASCPRVAEQQFKLEKEQNQGRVQPPGNGQPPRKGAPERAGVRRATPDRHQDPYRVGGRDQDQDLLEGQLPRLKRGAVQDGESQAHRDAVAPEDDRQRHAPMPRAQFRGEECG